MLIKFKNLILLKILEIFYSHIKDLQKIAQSIAFQIKILA
jgi:hypothetical protein